MISSLNNVSATSNDGNDVSLLCPSYATYPTVEEFYNGLGWIAVVLYVYCGIVISVLALQVIPVPKGIFQKMLQINGFKYVKNAKYHGISFYLQYNSKV